MTHAGVPIEEKEQFGIKNNLLRLSVGVENVQDLIWDLQQAVSPLKEKKTSNLPEKANERVSLV